MFVGMLLLIADDNATVDCSLLIDESDVDVVFVDTCLRQTVLIGMLHRSNLSIQSIPNKFNWF